MLVAGPAMLIRGKQGRDELSATLAEQKITFPERVKLPDELAHFAERPVDSGYRAKAYSDLIKSHLDVATSGRTYAEIIRELSEPECDEEKLTTLRQTAFTGETLRASLLGAYQAEHVTTLVMALGGLFTGVGAGLAVLASLRSRR